MSALEDPEQHAEESEALWNERQELREMKDGYALRFSGTMDYAERLLDFVRRERQCCPFLTFEIVFEPECRGIWICLRGDERVKAYLSNEFSAYST